MRDLPIDSVLTAAHRRWPDRSAAWVDQLKSDLAETCQRHNASVERILEARYALALSATSPHGPLVIRMSTDGAAVHHGNVARALAAVRVGPHVHDLRTTPSGVWLVSDRVIPGTPLADLRPSLWMAEAFAAALAPMLGQSVDGIDPLPRLDDWLRDRLLDDELTDIAPGRSVASRTARRRALGILDDLGKSLELGLCHGDASLWNILLSGDSSFRLIDPRGVAGEIAYDLAVIALKLGEHTTHGDLDRVASRLGLNHSRVAAWREVADAARV